MSSQQCTPIIIGVGDFVNRSMKLEDAREPLELILEAIDIALKDSKLTGQSLSQLKSSIDSIDAVLGWTWPYPDLPGLVANHLQVKLRHNETSPHGGNQPAKLLDDASRRISKGESKVAVITGGEALASLGVCAKANKMPPPGWTDVEKDVKEVFTPTARELGGELGGIHGIGAPIHIYPLYENGFRAARKQNMEDNNEESAELYGDFARIAAKNPLAWNYGKPSVTKETIKTISSKNRMICYPYPLLMNAFNNINLAGACIITSTSYAKELGIPKEQWIYPLGGAGTRDAYSFWERPNFHSSPAISQSLDAAFEVSGLNKEDIDVYDIYSCFPIVPKLVCNHLGLSLTGGSKPITLLGGLTSFGGAGNNYSMHAITEMTRHLRQKKSRHGLILANGGMLTYQFVVCLSATPRSDGTTYPEKNPLPESLENMPHPLMDQKSGGEAVIETYTVDFDREGNPTTGYVLARLKDNGKRVLANDADKESLLRLTSKTDEPIGKSCWISTDSSTLDRCLFTFARPGSKL